MRSDEALTKEVKDLVRTVLNDYREHFEKGELAAGVARANDVLRSAPEINEEVMKQAVWVGAGQPHDETFKATLDRSVDRIVKKKKLAGLSFAPHQDSLPRSVRRSVKTDEGIVIEYNTVLEGEAIRRTQLEDGTTQFVVTTRGYSDVVLADRVGRAR